MARQRAAARTVQSFSDHFDAIAENVAHVIQGKDEVIHLALVCLVAEGHLLIEDVPGVGKTSLAKALAASLDCTWGRIQFTPDLLPSRSEEHTSELQSRGHLVCRLLLEK